MIFSSVPASSCVVELHIIIRLGSELASYPTHLVETRKHVRKVQYRVTVLVHLVKDVIPEQLDNVPVTRL